MLTQTLIQKILSFSEKKMPLVKINDLNLPLIGAVFNELTLTEVQLAINEANVLH